MKHDVAVIAIDSVIRGYTAAFNFTGVCSAILQDTSSALHTCYVAVIASL